MDRPNSKPMVSVLSCQLAELYSLAMFLLTDTEPIYTQTTQEIVGRQGKTFTWSTKSKLMGQSERRGWEILFEDLQLTGDMEAMMEEARERRDILFEDCKLMPGSDAERADKGHIAVTAAVSLRQNCTVIILPAAT